MTTGPSTVKLLMFFLVGTLFAFSVNAHDEAVRRTVASRGEVQADIFVAIDGNDRWSGELSEPNAQGTDGPLATLKRAREAVHQLKTKAGQKKPITVMIRGGRYYLDETLVFRLRDSGTQDCPITYSAYPGERPILSGGRRISGWKLYKNNILYAEVPEATAGKWKFRQLFVNGQRQVRARYPNIDSANPLYGGWALLEAPAENGSATAFKYKAGTFRNRWQKPTQGEVNVFPGHGWYNSIIPIKAVDETTRVITLARSSRKAASWPGFQPENRFVVENLLEELDQPGEWCLDSEQGVVYFWPPTSSVEKAEIIAPVLDCLIDLRGCSFVKISGFTFTETTSGDNFHHAGVAGCGPMNPVPGLKYCGDTVHLKDATDCVIAENYFSGVGGNAVYLEGYNARNLLRRNEIGHAGAGGISLLGSKKDYPVSNRVEDNHIHHTGVYNKYSAGVFLGVSAGNAVRHNLIEQVPHHAINLGSNSLGRNTVEYNEIHYAAQETRDNGAINMWMEGDPMLPDTERVGHIIRYNFIADTPGETYLKHLGKHQTVGIYLDNYSSNCLVYGNLIVRVANSGILVHNGKNNVIENNVIVDNEWQMTFMEVWVPFGRGFMSNNTFQRNIVCYTDNYAHRKGFVFHLNPWTDTVVASSDNNLFFNAAGWGYPIMHIDSYMNMDSTNLFESTMIRTPVEDPITSLAQWQKKGYDTHSVIADPLFMDWSHDDYRLKPESPAFKLGFQAIDLDNIGIRKSNEK